MLHAPNRISAETRFTVLCHLAGGPSSEVPKDHAWPQCAHKMDAVCCRVLQRALHLGASTLCCLAAITHLHHSVRMINGIFKVANVGVRERQVGVQCHLQSPVAAAQGQRNVPCIHSPLEVMRLEKLCSPLLDVCSRFSLRGSWCRSLSQR